MDSSNEASSGKLRTPTDREKHRRSQYKSGSRSSEWKTKYRKRCMDRLKLSRERLVSRFRQLDPGSDTTNTPHGGAPGLAGGGGGGSTSMQGSPDMVDVSVQEVMEQEWEVMRTEDRTLPQITPKRKRGASLLDPARLECCKRSQVYNPAFNSDDEYEESEDMNYILSIIEDLTQELILEEQAMLAQCRDRQVEMDFRHYDEECLAAAAMDATCGTLLCPLCQKDYLRQDALAIYCSCGMHISSIHDGLSLDYLQQQLETSVTQHSLLCLGKPVFSLECTLGIQNLIMNCSLCDFIFVVL